MRERGDKSVALHEPSTLISRSLRRHSKWMNAARHDVPVRGDGRYLHAECDRDHRQCLENDVHGTMTEGATCGSS
jgi:hypothetical protein